MNNYNTVFRRIKEYCQQDNVMTGEGMQAIEQEISFTKGMPIANYLEVLLSLGMIRYCNENNEVSLTEKGMETNELFSM